AHGSAPAPYTTLFRSRASPERNPMDTALDACTTTRQLAVVRSLASLTVLARQAHATALRQITTAAERAQAPTAAYDSAIQQQHRSEEHTSELQSPCNL